LCGWLELSLKNAFHQEDEAADLLLLNEGCGRSVRGAPQVRIMPPSAFAGRSFVFAGPEEEAKKED